MTSAGEDGLLSIPLFQPRPRSEGDAAWDRLSRFCRWFADQPDVPPTVPLRSRVRRPLPLGLTRALGMSRVALGPVPGVRGWIVRWREGSPARGDREVAYLVTPSGRTFLLGRKNIAMFSDRHGFPPQPNPVSGAHAPRIVERFRSLIATQQEHD